VRWYLRYGLSYRDVEELLAERGIAVDQLGHITASRDRGVQVPDQCGQHGADLGLSALPPGGEQLMHPDSQRIHWEHLTAGRLRVTAVSAWRTATTALSVSPSPGAGIDRLVSSEGATWRAFARATVCERLSRRLVSNRARLHEKWATESVKTQVRALHFGHYR
jgi:hypothetical protein